MNRGAIGETEIRIAPQINSQLLILAAVRLCSENVQEEKLAGNSQTFSELANGDSRR
jgi:hypothetical protein